MGQKNYLCQHYREKENNLIEKLCSTTSTQFFVLTCLAKFSRISNNIVFLINLEILQLSPVSGKILTN